jgi:hypothetical protein
MFALKERQHREPDRDFVSQGVANIASVDSGGLPVGGSFSRSALGRLPGAKSTWSGAITGITVLAFLPFARVLEPLPALNRVLTRCASISRLSQAATPRRALTVANRPASPRRSRRRVRARTPAGRPESGVDPGSAGAARKPYGRAAASPAHHGSGSGIQSAGFAPPVCNYGRIRVAWRMPSCGRGRGRQPRP